jgi:hypothetical protein
MAVTPPTRPAIRMPYAQHFMADSYVCTGAMPVSLEQRQDTVSGAAR